MKKPSVKSPDIQIKSDKNSVKSQVVPKRVYDEYINIFTMQPVIVHDGWMEQFCGSMVKEVFEDKELIQVTEYFRRKGINNKAIARWKDKFPCFREAYDEIMLLIGDRREAYGLWKKLDAGMVAYTMAHYSKKWRDLAHWRSDLRKQSGADQQGNITVVMQPLTQTQPVAPLLEENL